MVLTQEELQDRLDEAYERGRESGYREGYSRGKWAGYDKALEEGSNRES